MPKFRHEIYEHKLNVKSNSSAYIPSAVCFLPVIIRVVWAGKSLVFVRGLKTGIAVSLKKAYK